MNRIPMVLIVVALLALAAGSAQAAGPLAPVASASTVQSNDSFDPFVGKSDLVTKAIPVANCFNGNELCELAPIGHQCWPANPLCRCVSSDPFVCAIP